MRIWIISFAAVGACFLFLDAIWLWNAGERFYRPLIGELLAPQFRIWPAALFYGLYVSGLVYFAVLPALAEQSLLAAVIKGALLGLVAYGTYDLTNQATMKVWPTSVTIVDLIWGSILSSTSSAVGYISARYFDAG